MNIPDLSALLPSGARMPLLGFGTWQITGEDAVTATSTALAVGYRHIDTATVYGNEAEVGSALASVARGDVFVTTQVPPSRRDADLDTLGQSLDLLKMSYVDLWLVHWLLAGGADLQVVKQRRGPRSIATSEKYLHTLPEADETALAAMDRKSAPPQKLRRRWPHPMIVSLRHATRPRLAVALRS